MAEPTDGARPDDFVPASFEDLRRTKPSADSRDDVVSERIRTRQDLGDMMADRGFMRNSKLVGIGAVVIGALLILTAYIRPLFETVDAVHTATAVASEKAAQGIDATRGVVGGMADKAAFVQATDVKAINMAKGGLGCLSGKAGCANGASSPFK